MYTNEELNKYITVMIPVSTYIDIMSQRYAENCQKCYRNGYMPLDFRWLKKDYWKEQLNGRI